MALATGAVVTTGQELLDGTAKTLVTEIKDTEGVTEQDAKDIVGNILIDLAVNTATIFTVLKTGAGVKVAEWLGLSSRGFAKKTLTAPVAAVATKIVGPGGASMVKSVIPKILKVLAVPGSLIWLSSALANIIEPGIYKPEQTNALYRKLGIPFQYPTNAGSRKAGLLETSEFNALADSLEKAGVSGIINPVALQTQFYSKEGLMDIIDYVTGKEVLKGNTATASKIRQLIAQYIIIKGGTSTYAPPATSDVRAVSVAPSTKVFTGIVSQGVVGQGLTFTPRPDDMIESVDELRQAAANNLAPFLNSLLGKIVYEVKVVASVITKEGFKQTGTTQRVQSGTYATGQARYKYVTNKFATLVVYALTDKGSRAKLTTVVLGPTNSAKLTVAQNDLRAIEMQLPTDVTTTDINEITGIATAQPITVTTPQEALATPDPATDAVPVDESLSPLLATAPVSTGAGQSSTTLSAWYQSRGLALPTVANRAIQYQQLGLGNSAYYTGTAEQNTKLLDALKKGTTTTQMKSNTPQQSKDMKSEKEPKNTPTPTKVSASEQRKLDAIGKQIKEAQKTIDRLVKEKKKKKK